jgi:hypothetical protein
MLKRPLKRDSRSQPLSIERLEERCVPTGNAGPLFAGAPISIGTPTSFSGVGGDHTSGGALNALNAFEAAIGGVRNTLPAPQNGGFRVITWDGVALDGTDFGGNSTVIVPNKVVGIPLNRFQTQGSFFREIYAVSGDGFQSVNSHVTSTLFPAFSPNNIFAMFNENTIEFHFVLASRANTTPVPALSRGFGAIFRNVELSNSTSIEYFHGSDSLGKFFVTPGTQGEAEFLGELFAQPIVTDITITLGTDAIFSFDGSTVTSGGADDPTHGHNLAVTDDFAYPEPVAAPPQSPIAANVNSLFQGTVAAFSDGDSTATPSNFTSTIDWGDGTTSAGTISVRAGGGFNVDGSHTYFGAGTLPISVHVQDFGGHDVTVTNTASVSGNAVITGTTGDDTLAIAQTNGTPGALTFVLNGAPAVNLTGVTSLTFNGIAGHETLIIDAGGKAALSVPGRFTIAGQPPIVYTNVQTVNFNNTAAVDSIVGPDTADRGALSGLSGNSRFVELLYLDVLGRAASASEISPWVTFLGTGGTRAEVISFFDQSQEARTRLVKSWYVQYLGRSAFNGEEQVWVNALNAGQSEDQVLSGILSSPEFFGRAQTLIASGSADERFVQALYALLLNRAAAPGELSAWVSAVGTLGLGGVARAIYDSGEVRIDVIDAIYGTLLHRPADPSGLTAFFNSSLSLTGIREAIEASDEFVANG